MWSDDAADTAIYRCPNCQLVFKFPALDSAQSEALYNAVDGSVWTSGMARPEFDMARDILAGLGTAAPSVLDVGCNRGEFLHSLPSTVKRYGIEVNRTAAAAAAAAVGAEVWPGLDSVPEHHRFDLISCFDVIEHVPNPTSFLDALLHRLKPGGCCVLSSGNAEVFLRSWRPAMNWYFCNPEHISFISRGWVAHFLKGVRGFDLVEARDFRHGEAPGGLVNALKVAAFKAWSRGYLWAYCQAKALVSAGGALFVPRNGHAQDHLCVVIVRQSVN